MRVVAYRTQPILFLISRVLVSPSCDKCVLLKQDGHFTIIALSFGWDVQPLVPCVVTRTLNNP